MKHGRKANFVKVERKGGERELRTRYARERSAAERAVEGAEGGTLS